MPGAVAYREEFFLKSAESLRVEVVALHGGPVTVTMAPAVKSIHLTPDGARRLGMLLARAAGAARGARRQPPDKPP